MAGLERLLRVLHQEVDTGHSAVLIEHNPGAIVVGDRVCEPGPGSQAGGRITYHHLQTSTQGEHS